MAVVLAGLASPFLTIAPADAAVLTCDGQRATIVGTTGDDILEGTPGNDVFRGLAGNDTLRGHGGNDRICGGYGADRVYGGTGNDRVFGGPDRYFVNDEESRERIGDQVRGGDGDDWLDAGRDTRPAGDVTEDVISWDTSTRGVTVDVLTRTAHGQGSDRFASTRASYAGSTHADVLRGSNGPDRLFGNAGDDRLSGRGGADETFDGAGRDVVWAGDGNDVVSGGTGRDALHGGPNDDLLVDGEPGANAFYGGRGDDQVEALLSRSPGAVYRGGAGVDRLGINSFRLEQGTTPTDATWDMVSGALVFSGPQSTSGSASGFEDVELATAFTAWAISGTAGGESLSALHSAGTGFDALGGDDSMRGSPLDDRFDGGPGVDSSPGMGEGTDTCVAVEQPGDCENVSP